MASRGHGPYEGRSIQAHEMRRHASSAHRSLEPLPPPELLEGKIATQAAEIEKLLRENRRLAAANEGMRQDVGDNQHELQRIKSHIGSIRTETDIQVRGLLEKIRKLDDDIRAAETVKGELQEAHREAKSIVITGQELTAEIRYLTEELQKKPSSDGMTSPEILAELDGLRKEHQELRTTFARAKGSNVEKVEQMYAMEKNLITLVREAEKLRADLKNAEKGERASNPYTGTYGHSHYADGYAKYQLQRSSAAVAVSAAGYSDGFGKPRVSGAAGGVSAGEGMDQYGGERGFSPVTPVDAA